MNEEELERMVARARDAEGAQSQPPPGLLDEARTATRRRRRGATVAAGCAVAAVIVATVTVPLWWVATPTTRGVRRPCPGPTRVS